MKKLISGIVCTCMVATTLISPAFAAEFTAVSSDSALITNDAQSEALGKAILAVKEKINVPEELSEFSYRYVSNNYSNNPYWTLSWRDKKYNKVLTVYCDDNGSITYYYLSDYEAKQSKPKFLKNELEDTALGYIKQIAPEVADKIVLKNTTFTGIFSGAYLYSYERIENGITMPDNSVQVSVDFETKELKSLSVNWDKDLIVPSAETKVTLDEARAKVGKEVKMELSYMRKIEEVDGKKISKAFLVYRPDKTYVAVDAKTGEVYTTKNEFLSKNDLTMEAATAGNMAMDSVADKGFTSEEIKKMDELKDLITKEEATKIVSSNSSLLIDDNAKAVDANLFQIYDYANKEEKEYVWSISFSDPKGVENFEVYTYSPYARATVDAKTGKILSFSASVRDVYDVDKEAWEKLNVKYSSEECKNVLEKFLKAQAEDKFKKTEFTDKNDSYVLKYVLEKPVYGGYTYNYTRVNEGVRYTYNSIKGSVDGLTGKIYSFNVNWDDSVVFESPKGAMTPQKAYETYSKKDGFDLVYEINNKHIIDEEKVDLSEAYSLEKEVRLVYRTSIYPDMISPFTGEQIKYDGSKYENEDNKEYTDISGFWAERQIKLMADLGITFSGDKFLPSKEVNEKELFEMMEKMGFYDYSEEKKSEDKIVTKLDVIKKMITSLGFDEVAKLRGIYKVDFADAANIPEEDLGYVAIAKGMNVVKGDAIGNLNVNNNVSRVELLVMLLNLIYAREI